MLDGVRVYGGGGKWGEGKWGEGRWGALGWGRKDSIGCAGALGLLMDALRCLAGVRHASTRVPALLRRMPQPLMRTH